MIAALLTVASPIFADVDLPDGQGREIVEAACSECHNFERIARQSLTADQWKNEVRSMMENGASVNPDEWDSLVAYLTKNFGPANKTNAAKINVNKDTAKAISMALRLTPAEAEAIVAYRAANGAFREIADLEKIPGVDAKKIDAQRDHIVF